MTDTLTLTSGQREYLKITSTLSREEIQHYLQFTTTRWLIGPWQEDATTSLLVCENMADIVGRFRDLFIADRILVEQVTAYITPFIEMARSHARAFQRLLLPGSLFDPSTHLVIYMKNMVSAIFNREQTPNFRPDYYEVVSSLYMRAFAEVFAMESNRVV